MKAESYIMPASDVAIPIRHAHVLDDMIRFVQRYDSGASHYTYELNKDQSLNTVIIPAGQVAAALAADKLK